jgi:hypothetical protein
VGGAGQHQAGRCRGPAGTGLAGFVAGDRCAQIGSKRCAGHSTSPAGIVGPLDCACSVVCPMDRRALKAMAPNGWSVARLQFVARRCDVSRIGMRIVKVFIGSTDLDLREHREAAEKTCAVIMLVGYETETVNLYRAWHTTRLLATSSRLRRGGREPSRCRLRRPLRDPAVRRVAPRREALPAAGSGSGARRATRPGGRDSPLGGGTAQNSALTAPASRCAS